MREANAGSALADRHRRLRWDLRLLGTFAEGASRADYLRLLHHFRRTAGTRQRDFGLSESCLKKCPTGGCGEENCTMSSQPCGRVRHFRLRGWLLSPARSCGGIAEALSALVAGGVTASGRSGLGRFNNPRGEPCGMWKQDESGRVHTPFEPVVLAATLALIPVLIIEADATSDGWQDVRGGRELDHLGDLRDRARRRARLRRTEAGRAAGALARRGDRRPHDPAPRQGARLAPARSLHPPSLASGSSSAARCRPSAA